MKGVGARLDRLVELATRGVSKLWRELILQHSELIDCVIGHLEQRPGDTLVVVVDALHCEVVIAWPLSGNRRSGSQPHAAAGSNTSVEQRQIDHAASNGGDRQIFELLALIRILQLCCRRTEARGNSRNFN